MLFAALVVYAIYRSTQRAAIPVEETGSFVAMSPAGTTVVGMEIAQEWAIESAEAAQDDLTARKRLDAHETGIAGFMSSLLHFVN